VVIEEKETDFTELLVIHCEINNNYESRVFVLYLINNLVNLYNTLGSHIGFLYDIFDKKTWFNNMINFNNFNIIRQKNIITIFSLSIRYFPISLYRT